MRRFFTILLLLLCPIAATARVISYAPYTDQQAIRGHHERTTRHFVLVEEAAQNVADGRVVQGKVVLYDTAGLEPPRVILDTPDTVRAAALYQPRPDAAPVVLVLTGQPLTGRTFISRNGGRSWRQIVELDGLVPRPRNGMDRGGPWTYGLGAQVRIGSRGYPFVVAYDRGVYAISATRAPRLLLSDRTGAQTIVGQNREGTELLLFTQEGTLIAAGLDGRWRGIGKPAGDPPGGGWIAPDGTAYTTTSSRLHRYVNGRQELVADLADFELTFAVPTHNFTGAWMIGHTRGEVTALSRYTPAGGLQTMWEDPAAPEVEAVHAGASGNTLLIQVHRERDNQELLFIDPALAVWRVGEPAPAVYDELFLNEGPGKGFVHLDVERVAEGEPFVFDSSFIRSLPPDIVVSPPSGGGGAGGDVIQEWGVVRASLRQRLVLQGLTNERDLLDLIPNWRTDLVVSNPLDAEQRVEVEFVPLSGQPSSKTTITLAPRETRYIDDAIHWLLDRRGQGALHLVPEVAVGAVAQVRADEGHGYAVQPVDAMNAAGPRFPVTFAAVTPVDGFRSEVILTDTTGQGIDAEIRRYEKGTEPHRTHVATADPYYRRPTLELVGASGAAMAVHPNRGALIAGAAVTDQTTRDLSYFAPDLPASSVRTIPLVANTGRLTSDLYLVNLSASVRTVFFEAKPYDTAQWPRTQTYRLEPFESRVIANPLQTLFKLTGLARVRYSSPGAQGDASGVRVTSRLYTAGKDGGTYGTALPPLNNFQSITGHESLEILGSFPRHRLSLGLVDLTPSPRGGSTNMRVSLVDERGDTLATIEQSIALAGGVFIESLFSNVPMPAAARIVIETLDAEGLVGAYAILTDPTTGDPTYLGPQLGATPK